jgi:hypothetical protein
MPRATRNLKDQTLSYTYSTVSPLNERRRKMNAKRCFWIWAPPWQLLSAALGQFWEESGSATLMMMLDA